MNDSEKEVLARVKHNLEYLSHTKGELLLGGAPNGMAVINWSIVAPDKDANEILDGLQRIGTTDYDPGEGADGDARIGWTVQLPPRIGGELLLDLITAF
jgi:hypothetical protein